MKGRIDLCVIGGAGHVGFPLAVVFADRGLRVLVYDVDEQALTRISEGHVPHMDQGIEPLLRKALDANRLSFTSRPSEVAQVPALVITIGTPVEEYLSPSLRAIKKCVDELLPSISDGQLMVLRSTVSPGTTRWLDDYLRSKGKLAKVSFCPERVVQGRAVEELQKLPQIVSGTTPEAEEEAARLFARIAPEVVRLTPLEAEFAKLFSNSYRYIQFAIANQLYVIANNAGVDYYRVLGALKKNYPRAADIPAAGLAAGPCLLKDTMQLAAFANNYFSLGHAAMQINEGLVLYIGERLAAKFDLKALTVGLLGMAFKADSDDTRESLSYRLKKILSFRAKEVLTTDPHVRGDSDLRPVNDVVSRSDLLVLCVPHSAYRGLDTRGKPLMDIWNFFGRGGML